MSTTHAETPTTATYQVPGISCQHCVNALTAEIGALPGVRQVEVLLDRSEVVVHSAYPLRRADVAEAVDEAGYRLADEPTA